ncbi:hypothetical protein IGI58_000739 [Enterococcus sp. AZ020]
MSTALEVAYLVFVTFLSFGENEHMKDIQRGQDEKTE